MADEQKISKWWFSCVPLLANLYLLVGFALLVAGALLGFHLFLRSTSLSVFVEWIYEPVRRALGLSQREFYSRFTMLFIWELVAFAGGLLCYGVGLLCYNVAAMRRRAPDGEGQQPGDRGEP